MPNYENDQLSHFSQTPRAQRALDRARLITHPLLSAPHHLGRKKNSSITQCVVTCTYSREIQFHQREQKNSRRTRECTCKRREKKRLPQRFHFRRVCYVTAGAPLSIYIAIYSLRICNWLRYVPRTFRLCSFRAIDFIDFTSCSACANVYILTLIRFLSLERMSFFLYFRLGNLSTLRP